ncbi:MAG TPA: 50S ribosomal protein L13 [Anaerolineales bacterium]|nr:50S ribosomal protein L13 [Anaerolineales bacterium]
MQKTYYPKAEDVRSRWVLVDAQGKNLGRLASRVAQALLGKARPDYTPGVDLGDFVIVINAGKVAVTGKRLEEKVYYRASGYPGGLKAIPLRDQLARHPERVIQSAVRGMLPKSRQGRRLMRRLHVYAGTKHPHSSQKPVPLNG